MNLYKVTVQVGPRNIDVTVKQGILATVETGTRENRVNKPKSKVAVLVGTGRAGLSAWVQLSEFHSDGTLSVTNEGWVAEGSGDIGSMNKNAPASASLSRIANPTPEMIKCQEDADFGPLACCTSSGNGCYVNCCGGCCSDPVGCPGAGCCP
jgi:hypothetical protein